mgnify:CR=1 FL=1
MFEPQYGGICAAPQPQFIAPLTLTERLQQDRTRLAQRLTDLDEAIGALKENPQLQKACDAISRLRHIS